MLVAITGFLVYFPDYSRLKKLREENNHLKNGIRELNKEIAGLRSHLKRLNNDEFLWEHLAHKNVGVIAKDEIVVDIHNKGE